MIQINDRDFDWNVIRKLYGPSSKLVSFVKQGNDGKGGVEKFCQTGHPVTAHVFKEWFFDPSTNTVSPNRISQFLLHKDPVFWIESYAELTCEVLWGNKKLAQAFLFWKLHVAEAIEEQDKEERANKLSSVIGDEHISASMFEIEDGAHGQYRLLKASDLQKPVRNKTLCE